MGLGLDTCPIKRRHVSMGTEEPITRERNVQETRDFICKGLPHKLKGGRDVGIK